VLRERATLRAGLSLIDVLKMAGTEPLTCDGDGEEEGEAGPPIVGLAFDTHLPQLLFASTSTGSLRVYNTKTRVRAPSGGKSHLACKLVEEMSGHAPLPVAIASVKGFLLSATSELFAVHNVSGLYGRVKKDPHVVYGEALMGGSIPALLACSRASHLALSWGADGRVVYMESKLQWKDEDSAGGMPDMLSFLRNPMLIGVVMVVIFWQSSKFFSKGGGGGGVGGLAGLGGGGGFGPKGMGDFDPSMLQDFEKTFARGGLPGRGGGNSKGLSSRIEELNR